MVQQVKGLAAEPDNLNLIPELAWWKERTNSHQPSSGFHTCILLPLCAIFSSLSSLLTGVPPCRGSGFSPELRTIASDNSPWVTLRMKFAVTWTLFKAHAFSALHCLLGSQRAMWALSGPGPFRTLVFVRAVPSVQSNGPSHQALPFPWSSSHFSLNHLSHLRLTLLSDSVAWKNGVTIEAVRTSCIGKPICFPRFGRFCYYRFE